MKKKTLDWKWNKKSHKVINNIIKNEKWNNNKKIIKHEPF